MDKFRALTIYTKSLLRNFQGSGELSDSSHIFYEAKRLIEKNGWEEEASELLNEEYENVKKNYSNLEKEYSDYIKSGEKSEIQENYFNRFFRKLGVDGRAEIIVKYRAMHNGEDPSIEEFRDLVKKREEEDKRNALTFIENQVKISNGEDFNIEELKESAKYLKNRGLYNIILRNLACSINCYDAEKVVGDYDSHFNLSLY